jgi:hypothetical protein
MLISLKISKEVGAVITPALDKARSYQEQRQTNLLLRAVHAAEV